MNKKSIIPTLAAILFSVSCQKLETKLRDIGPEKTYCEIYPKDYFCEEERRLKEEERKPMLQDPYFLTQKFPRDCEKPNFTIDNGVIYLVCLNYNSSYSIYFKTKGENRLTSWQQFAGRSE